MLALRPAVRRLLGLVLVVVAIPVAVSTPWVKAFVFERATAWARERFGLEIRAERFDYHLLALSVSADALTVADLASPDRPMARVARLDIDVAASALEGRLDFDSISARDVQLDIDLTTGRAGETPSAGRHLALPPFTIEGISVENLDLSLHDEEVRLDVRDIAAALHGFRREGELGGTITAAGGLTVSFDRDAVRIAFERAEARVELENRSAVRAWVDASSAVGDLRATGHVPLGIDAPIELQYEGAMLLEELRRWWPGAPDWSGRANLRGTVAGSFRSPEATFRASGRELAWSALAPAAIEATGHVSSRELGIESLALDTRGASVSGGGSLAFRPTERSTLSARWANLGTDVVAELSGRAFTAKSPVLIEGTATLTWPGTRPRLDSVDGRVDTTVDGSATGGAAKGTLTGTGSNGRWRVSYRQELDGGTKARFDGDVLPRAASLADSRIRGTVAVKSADADAAIGQLRRAGLPIPAGVEALHPRSLVVDGQLDGTALRPRLHAQFGADELHIGGVEHVRAQGTVGVDGSGLTMSPASLSTTSGEVVIRGTLPWSEGSGAGAFDIEVIDPAPLLPMVPPAWAPSGTIKASGAWHGTARSPEVDLHLAATNIMSNGVGFTTLDADLAYSGGTLTATAVRGTQSTGGTLDGAGSWRFQDAAIRATVRARDVEALVAGRGPMRVNLDADARDGRARLAASVPAYNATVDGQVAMEASLPFEGRLTLTGSNIATLANLAGLDEAQLADVHASVDATVDASGLGRELAASRATLSVTKLDGTVGGQPLHLAQAGRVQIADERLRVLDPVRLTLGSTVVDLAAPKEPGAQPGIAATLEGSLAELTALVAGALPDGLAAAGSVRAEVLLGDRLTELRPAGQVSAADVRLTQGDTELARDFTIRAEADLQRIRVHEARGVVLGGPLDAAGAAPAAWLWPGSATTTADPGEPATFRIRSDVDVGSVLAAIRKDIPRVAGTMRVAVDGLATAPRLDAVQATLHGEGGTLTAGAYTLRPEGGAVMRLEQGRLSVDGFHWKGPDSDLSAAGSVGVVDGVDGRLHLVGDASLGVLTLFMPARVDGRARFDLDVSGPPGAREVLGTIGVSDGTVVVPEWRLSMVDWSGTFVLDASGIEVRQVRGQFNGGEATIDGRLPGRAGSSDEVITISVRNAFLDVPRGLRSQLDADLEWSRGPSAARLSGTATVTARAYREPVTEVARLISELIDQSGAKSSALPAALAATEVDVHLSTVGPLAITNSVARVELVPDLQLTGTLGLPALRGQVAVADEGRIQFSGRQYRLRESRLEFSPEQGLMPRLAVAGETRVGDYTVFLRLSGAANEIETALSSDPPLGERDLQTLLVTGQREELGRGSSSDQNAVGAVSGDVLGLAGQFLGFDSVMVSTTDDLSLVSSDVDPALRLTVSKRIGRRFELVLSDNLDDNELTWVIIYRPRPGFEFRAVSRDNTEYTGEFRQEIAFGPGVSPPRTSAPRRVTRERVAAVAVTGEPGFTPGEVLSVTTLRVGDRFEFGRWLEDRDRLARLYRDRGYLAARIVPTRQDVAEPDGARRVSLTYRVTRGPQTVLAIQGYQAPTALLEQLQQAWADSVLIELLDTDLERVMREHLVNAGYLRASVSVAVDRATRDRITATIAVEPGPTTSERRIVFSGNRAITTEALLAEGAAQDVLAPAWVDAAPLLAWIESTYAARGYLAVKVTSQPIEHAGAISTLPISIVEGPLARVTALTVSGANRVSEAEVLKAASLAVGSPYRAGSEQVARLSLERYYRNLGYRDVAVTARADVRPADGSVDLALTLVEGAQYVVASVRTTGVESTREALVERATQIEAGTPASPALAEGTRRRLYDIGTFRSAEVTFVPAAGSTTQGVVPVDAMVSLQESKRFLFLYGIETTNQYQSLFDQRVTTGGVAADLRDRNFLGRGWTLGAGLRYEPSFDSVRLLMSVPRIRSTRIRTNFYANVQSEERARSEQLILRDDETNLTIEQRWRPRQPVELSWGYRYNARTLRFLDARDETEAFRSRFYLASLASAVVVDRRDNLFDAKRGWLLSATGEWGLQPLGSDFDYLRTVVRGSHYLPLGPLTLASNVRWGNLIQLKGQPPLTVLDIFFTAGGTQTVRGFKQDSLSAYVVRFQDAHIPVGGTKLLIFNEEVRFPLFWLLSGAGFVDVGNTFASQTEPGRNTGPLLVTIEDSELAVGAGFGLRIRTPLAPVRIDLGFPLRSNTGQTSIRWHFSIGQIF